MRTAPLAARAALLLPFFATDLFTSASPVKQSRAAAAEPIHIPLTRRAIPKTASTFLHRATKLRGKYGADQAAVSSRKRASSGTVYLTDEEDSEFYGTIQVGSSQTAYSVVVDTGSSDLLLATSPCTGCDSSTPLYNPTSSTSATTSSTQFSITYGTGDASGTLVQDEVSIGGYTMSKQTFAACTTMDGIVSSNITGLLGLGWTSIASSGATPLVEGLGSAGTLPAQEFGFAFRTTTSYTSETPGGVLTIGATPTSLYSGSINWIPAVEPYGYWMIPLQDITVGGTSLGISADSVVIDSGTTLIGAPQEAVSAIYASISGAQAVTLQGSSGYYSYPCSTNVNVAFQFGNKSYAITSSNFNAGAVDSSGTTCLGSIFVLSGSSLEWIIGDSFLVGYYSAFRFSDTPAVGFATLGSGGSSTSDASSSTTTSTTSTSSASSTLSSSASGPLKVLVGLMMIGLTAALSGSW